MTSFDKMHPHLQTMQVALVNLAAIHALQPFQAEKEYYNRYQEQNIKSFNTAFSQLSNTDILRLLMNRESLNPLNTKAHPLWALDVEQAALIQFDARPIDSQNSSAGFKLTYPKEDSETVTIGHKKTSTSTQEPVSVLRSGGTLNGMKRAAKSVKTGKFLDTESSNANIQSNYAEQIQHTGETLHDSVVFRNFMRLLLTETSTQSIVRAKMEQFQSSEKNTAMLIAIPCVLGVLTALASLFVNLSTTPTLLAGLITHAPLALLLMGVCGGLYKWFQLNTCSNHIIDIQNSLNTQATDGTYLEQYNTQIQAALTQLMNSDFSKLLLIKPSNPVAPAESPLRPATAGVAAPATPTKAVQREPSPDQLKRLEQTASVLRKLDDAIQSGDASTLLKKDVKPLNSAYLNNFTDFIEDHRHLTLNKELRSLYIGRVDAHTLTSLKQFVTDKHHSRTATLNR